MVYNWQQKDWPNFKYNLDRIEEKLYLFSEKTGMLSGVLKALPEDARMETIIDTMVAEAVKTSEIEGEFLSRKEVMSSIRNNLGFKNNEPIGDKRAKGIGELMVAVRNNYGEPMSAATLSAWHKMLFGDDPKLKIGAWRDHEEPMLVVSGAIGKEKVHFEAPPSKSVPHLMEDFIDWFNRTGTGGKDEIKQAPIRCAIAHLYFESIHPFEDGNGRIGRAIAEKALSQGVGRPVLLSLSRTIEANKNQYYSALEAAQRSNEITPWLSYFVEVIINAQCYAEDQIDFTLKKARFFDKYSNQFNQRQLKVIKRVLEEGPDGFEGGINAAKYGSLTRISKATATRDLQDLLLMGALIVNGGGRSTKYVLNI